MATSDTELADEVRQFTGYTDTSTLSDSDLQSIISIGKDEIRSAFNQPDFTFYRESPVDTLRADRALFWFSCIGTKVRLGELGNIDLTIDGLETADPSEDTYRFWLSQFHRHLSAASTQFSSESGAASKSIERTDRSYSFDLP